MDSSGNSSMAPTAGGQREAASRRRKAPKEIDVNTLFQGEREVLLLHRGEAYSLRITANGKLILTK